MNQEFEKPMRLAEYVVKQYELMDNKLISQTLLNLRVQEMAVVFQLEPVMEMFIVCDGKETPLQEPDKKYKGGGNAVGSSNSFTKEYSRYLDRKAKVMFDGFIFRESRGGYPAVTNGRIEITFDNSGAWLEPYGSCDGIRLNSIEKLEPVFNYLSWSKEMLKNLKTYL